jgi:hypothetical protein
MGSLEVMYLRRICSRTRDNYVRLERICFNSQAGKCQSQNGVIKVSSFADCSLDRK